MNTVNAIAFGLKDTITKGYEPDIGEDYTIGEYVEDELYSACNSLAAVAAVTEGKIDVEFLLQIVGAYMVAKKKGDLAEDTVPPCEIFDTTMVEAMESWEEPKVEKDEDAEEQPDNPSAA